MNTDLQKQIDFMRETMKSIEHPLLSAIYISLCELHEIKHKQKKHIRTYGISDERANQGN